MSVTPTPQQALKAATRRLIAACGGQESAALIPGMPIQRHQSFSEAGSPAHPDRMLRIDVVALLEADCGLPLVTAALAKGTGHVLVALPAVAGGDARLLRVTAEALKEVSEVFARLSEYLADGTLSTDEGAQLDREIDGAIVKLLQLRAQIDALAGREG